MLRFAHTQSWRHLVPSLHSRMETLSSIEMECRQTRQAVSQTAAVVWSNSLPETSRNFHVNGGTVPNTSSWYVFVSPRFSTRFNPEDFRTDMETSTEWGAACVLPPEVASDHEAEAVSGSWASRWKRSSCSVLSCSPFNLEVVLLQSQGTKTYILGLCYFSLQRYSSQWVTSQYLSSSQASEAACDLA